MTRGSVKNLAKAWDNGEMQNSPSRTGPLVPPVTNGSVIQAVASIEKPRNNSELDSGNMSREHKHKKKHHKHNKTDPHASADAENVLDSAAKSSLEAWAGAESWIDPDTPNTPMISPHGAKPVVNEAHTERTATGIVNTNILVATPVAEVHQTQESGHISDSTKTSNTIYTDPSAKMRETVVLTPLTRDSTDSGAVTVPKEENSCEPVILQDSSTPQLALSLRWYDDEVEESTAHRPSVTPRAEGGNEYLLHATDERQSLRDADLSVSSSTEKAPISPISSSTCDLPPNAASSSSTTREDSDTKKEKKSKKEREEGDGIESLRKDRSRIEHNHSSPGAALVHEASVNELEALSAKARADTAMIRQLSQQVQDQHAEIQALRDAGGLSHFQLLDSSSGNRSQLDDMTLNSPHHKLLLSQARVQELEIEVQGLREQLTQRTRQMQEQQKAFNCMLDSAERLAVLEAEEMTSMEKQLEAMRGAAEETENKSKEAELRIRTLTARIKVLENQVISKEAGAVAQALAALGASSPLSSTMRGSDSAFGANSGPHRSTGANTNRVSSSNHDRQTAQSSSLQKDYLLTEANLADANERWLAANIATLTDASEPDLVIASQPQALGSRQNLDATNPESLRLAIEPWMGARANTASIERDLRAFYEQREHELLDALEGLVARCTSMEQNSNMQQMKRSQGGNDERGRGTSRSRRQDSDPSRGGSPGIIKSAENAILRISKQVAENGDYSTPKKVEKSSTIQKMTPKTGDTRVTKSTSEARGRSTSGSRSRSRSGPAASTAFKPAPKANSSSGDKEMLRSGMKVDLRKQSQNSTKAGVDATAAGIGPRSGMKSVPRNRSVTKRQAP